MGPQVLYQGIERLDKEKADREHLEMEIDVVSTRPQEPLCLLPGQRRGLRDMEPAGGMEGHFYPCSSLLQKADKSALASKVSRIQFDATTEQLNHMMQELVAKMSGQEQDWQKLVDKLLAEMDSKVRAGEVAGQARLLSTQAPAARHHHFLQS